jgi:ubiquinone/menaquinone biosynthesis C-methylase UbiE
MEKHEVRAWAFDRPIRSPFALPRGLLGRLAGRFMLWTNDQREVLDLLDVKRGDRVLEVGYGPGGLIRLLADRTEAAAICGVDPSLDMQRDAARRNRRAIAAGRVELRLGTAAATGLPDASFDRLVSVHNVALWPDLEGGVRELHRVARPGGVVVLAWHGGEARSRIARSLRLPEEKLERIRATLAACFAHLEQFERTYTVVFRATK